MSRALSAVATAACVGSLLAAWVAGCLNELDEALSEYLTEIKVPDYVPAAFVSDH